MSVESHRRDVMYAEERQQAIAEQVRTDGRVSVTALAATFTVTNETVRRDLAVLERGGHLQRVHGGAVRSGTVPGTGELDVYERAVENPDAKAAIGRAAMRFLPADRGSLYIDAGTTTLQAAGMIPADHRLTVLTHSLPIASSLAGHPSADLHVLGGRVRGITQAMVGAGTLTALHGLRVSTAFVGTNGISAEHGLSTPDPEEAAIKSAIVRSANHVVVLADSSKLGRTELTSFATLDDIDVLVTEVPPDASRMADFDAHGIEVVIA